jgi:hypothetical protein
MSENKSDNDNTIKSDTSVNKDISANDSQINKEDYVKNTTDKVFDTDKNINSALMNIIIWLIIIILLITTVVIFFNSLINYILFCYFTINQAIIESDDSNLEKLKINDIYSFKLMNYIYCYNKSETQKDDKTTEKFSNNQQTCQNNSNNDTKLSDTSNNVINYLTNLFNPIDSCDVEPAINIFGGNKLYTISFRIIYFILITIFIGTVIYIIITMFLGGIRQYTINGTNMLSYVFINEQVYITILLLVIFYAILHGVLFKHLFTDNVYSRLYNNYLEMLKLDMYIYDEMKNIEREKDFLNILFRSTPNNIDIEYETNMHNKKIIDNITNSENDDIKAVKIFLYSIYIYLKRQNEDNINIINIINQIITQSPKNNRTIRSLLNLKINNTILSGDLNNIVSRIVSDGLKIESFEIFDFNNLSAYDENSLNYKLAFKINRFYDILINMNDKIDFSRVVYYLNIYLVLEIVINIIYMILILVVFWLYSDKNPFMKRIIDILKNILMSAFDELRYALLGV